MHNGFGVRARGETVATFYQVVMEIEIIVNFSVQHHPHFAVFIRERLMAPGNIDDAESPEAKSDAGRSVDAFVIRAAMNDGLRHSMDGVARYFMVLIEFKKAANAAHIFSLFSYGIP
jgi:hypothetical protein